MKSKKESLMRTKDLVKITNELEYKTTQILGNIHQLSENSDQVEKYPEDERAEIVKNLYMAMIELMENLDGASKVENSKIDISKLSYSKTFSKKNDSRFLKQDVIDISIAEDNEAIKKQIEELDRKNAVVKKMRVLAQKEIFECERKINFIEEEVPEEEKNELENLNELDLNQEATLTNER